MPVWSFVNNGFVKDEEALLSVRDLSVQRAYGVFDFFRYENKKTLFLKEHLDRFFNSAQYMRLPVRLSASDLKDVIHQLILRNESSQGGIRITLTGGYSPDGASIGEPNLLIFLQDFQSPSEQQISKGIRLITHKFQRQLPWVKTIDYLMATWLQPQLKEKWADELLYHYAGKVTESPRSNFFIVTKDNKVVTAKQGVLKGITRSKVIALASEDFVVEERDLSIEEIEQAKEAFITSTTKKILPVRSIDNAMFDVGEHTITMQLLEKLKQHCTASGNF